MRVYHHVTTFTLIIYQNNLPPSDPGHKADGEVVTRSEEQPEQIRQLDPEDADGYTTQ